MSTLGALKAEIADDLARPDLTTQIASAINSAITFYKKKRFYFNEDRDTTFSSAASQSEYTATESANIPLFFQIDSLYVTPSGGVPIPMTKEDPDWIEFLISTGLTGQPWRWGWFAQSLRFYPIPSDATFTFRVVGAREFAAPTDDSVSNNVWMQDPYELIRCRAKKYLYAHVLKNQEQAALMEEAERQALSDLRKASTDKRSIGRIASTSF